MITSTARDNASEIYLEQLNAFMPQMRQTALTNLLERWPEKPDEKPWVNLHLHSFFSFNGEGWSPSRLAWEARQRGLYAAGVCDFDTLDGLEEMLLAGDLLGLRTMASMESRVFFSEYADQEINSPGEPGVFYFMGAGFVEQPDPTGEAGRIFAEMTEQAHQRNQQIVQKINSCLPGPNLDYKKDVLPLTPSGNPTERHIVRAYFDRALLACDSDLDETARWWAEALNEEPDKMRKQISDLNGFLDLLRARMMKRGGLGYRQPTPDTFPPLDRVIKMILACRAVPTSAWLDGGSAGESDPKTQLECLMEKGVAAVNIIPDRNWNYADARVREQKVRELHRYTAIADQLELPIMVGTEMNKAGQRFVDDFKADPMQAVAPSFLRGAQIMIGHTRLLRYADFSYVDQKALDEFPDRRRRNDFFAAVGALPPPEKQTRDNLEELEPDQAYALLHDAASAGQWNR